MAYKAVIFDLDGTLLDSLADIADAANHVLTLHGYPQHDYATYKQFIGNGLGKLIERAVPPNTSHETCQTMLAQLRDYYARHWAIKTVPYPGIDEALQHLKERGYPLFVLSNKDHPFTVDMVHHFFGTNLFTEIHGLKKGKPAKPDPMTTKEICLRHRLTPSNGLFVGDLTVDILTAQNASLHCVGVRWGFRPHEIEKADYLIGHPQELLALLS